MRTDLTPLENDFSGTRNVRGVDDPDPGPIWSGPLPVGRAVEFEAFVRGRRRPCFLLRPAEGGPVAFVNICANRNQPVVIDAFPLLADGRIECVAHGARYDAASGLCIEGPCAGESLVPIEVREDGGAIFAVADDALEDELISAAKTG